MSDKFAEIIENVELMLLERRALRTKGPHFRIVHRFSEPGSDCMPGEEIMAVFLVTPRKEYAIPMSSAMLLLFDYLARHARLPQTAAQIVRGIEADPFSQEHGSNISTHPHPATRISLSEIKVYVQRIRAALASVFRKAGMPVDPEQVLISEDTASNRLAYRLKGSFEWMHAETGRRCIAF